MFIKCTAFINKAAACKKVKLQWEISFVYCTFADFLDLESIISFSINTVHFLYAFFGNLSIVQKQNSAYSSFIPKVTIISYLSKCIAFVI